MAKTKAVAVEEVEPTEEDVAEAKRQRKEAKKAAKAGAATPAVEEAVVEPTEEELAEEKRKRKAAKKAAKAGETTPVVEEAVVEPTEEELAEEKRKKKEAKKAAKAAAAAAEAEEEDEDAPPKKKIKKEESSEGVPTPAKVKTEDVKMEPVKDAAADDEEWKDNTYKCIDCSEDWVDEIGDQQFRYDKGFAETPKRCKDCRWAKKVRMEGGDPAEKGKGKGKGKAGGDENTVFVRGLPFSATEEALNKDFGECGEIASLRMPLNDEGSCRGIAFIKYTSKEGMDKAMAFNETDYGGRTIFCSDAAIKPEGKGKGKDGKGKGKDGKDGKGKGKKGKKGKATSESFAKNTGAMVESTGKKTAFEDSDDE